MAVNKVNLYVSQIIEDLNNGLTWLKKDDLGYGSIEVKYGANEKQIFAIRKHPALKDAETNITVFNIIDDTKELKPQNETSNQTKRSSASRTDNDVEQPVVSVESHSTGLAVNEAADIFAQL